MSKGTQEQKLSLDSLLDPSTETAEDIRFSSEGEIVTYRLPSEAQIGIFIDHLRTLTNDTVTPEYQDLFDKAELICKSKERLRLQKIAQAEFLLVTLLVSTTLFVGMLSLIGADTNLSMRSIAVIPLLAMVDKLFLTRFPMPFDQEESRKMYIAQQNFVSALNKSPYGLMLFDSYDPYAAAKSILKATVEVRRGSKNLKHKNDEKDKEKD